jgi:radical SAM-linked protein
MSHLDMNRFMTRAIKRASLPVWHTDGFNPHPYITFALPLSLGFDTECDCVDIRLTEDDFPMGDVVKRLNAATPKYINFLSAEEPVKKLSEVAFCRYEAEFDDGGEIKADLERFLKSDSIICEKKTKKGDIKQIDIKEKISDYKVFLRENNTLLSLVLPAGPECNINPELLLSAFFKQGNFYCYIITRKEILDKEFKGFR